MTEAERLVRHLSTLGSNPWDWESFTWGFTVGGIVVTALSGVVLYFAWPYVVEMVRWVPLFQGAVEEAKRLGIL